MAVPQQGQLLPQGDLGGHHAVQPPQRQGDGLLAGRLLGRQQRGPVRGRVHRVRRERGRRQGVGCRVGVGQVAQPVDGGLIVGVDRRHGGAGAAEQRLRGGALFFSDDPGRLDALTDGCRWQ